MRTVGGRVSEPEIKFLFVVLLGLGGLADAAGSEAVLPAYLIGLVVAGVFATNRVIVDRLRTIAFALPTPFFFLQAGVLVSFRALGAGVGAIIVLFAVRIGHQGSRRLADRGPVRTTPRERTYTTLLMLATGLPFGSIAALYGLTNNLIDQTQYSVHPVTVVILSALRLHPRRAAVPPSRARPGGHRRHRR